MKRLLMSFLFVLVALFVVDRMGGRLMWWVSQHTQDIYGPKQRYMADEVCEDLVLIGTSRCNHHYVPSILSDTLGMSVYNSGVDGNNGFYSHYCLLNLMLEHHMPKVICLEMSSDNSTVADKPFERIHAFAPYIGRSEWNDSLFKEAGYYWRYRISHLCRYNAMALRNIGGLFENHQKGADRGYNPILSAPSFPSELGVRHTSHDIDTLKLSYLQKVIARCRQLDIKLIFMVSPTYTVADADLYDVLKTVARANDVPFLDYDSRKIFHDKPEYFKDETHLLDKGARIFTSMFAHDLKAVLSE